jgi:hypothetical protein
MKKAGLLFVGLTIAIFAHGQIVKFQGGTSISKLDWRLNDNASLFDKPLIGYSIFAGIDYFDKQYFNLSSNVGMLRKGGKSDIIVMDQYGIPTGETLTSILDYVSVNTTIDFKYPIQENFSPFMSFGPRFDYLLHKSKNLDEVGDNLKNTSIGLLLGGGIKYDISNLQFGLRADYYLDFAKIASWSAENNRARGEISGNTFTINLTVGYKLK